MPSKASKNLISQCDVDTYTLVKPLLESIHQEMSELTKKKPDGLLNVYKLNLINKVLQPIKDLLKDEPVAAYLEILSEEAMPSNSDVLLLLGQYEKATKMFFEKYTFFDANTYSSKWSIG